MGDRSPLTEKDFNKVDLDRLKVVVKRQIAGGLTSGSIGYGDYGAETGRTEYSAFHGLDQNETLAETIMNSFTDPTYRLETTLGRATWRQDEDGSIVIEDRYNFNVSRDTVNEKLAKYGQGRMLYEEFATGGFDGLLETLGIIYGDSSDEAGNVVKINLGKL